MDLLLVSVDSTAARAHQDAAGMHLRRRGIKAVIPEKRDQAANRKRKGRKGGRPVDHDAGLYKDPRAQARAATSRVKAAMMTATRT